MQLQAGVHHLALQVGDPIFGHRRGGGVEFRFHHLLETAVHERPADLDLGLKLRQLVLGDLEIEHGAAESLAFAYIIDGPAQGGFGGGNARDRDLQALPGQFPHEQFEALALGTQPRVTGKLNILEKQLGGVLRVHAELVEVAALRETRKAGIHQKQRDALGTGGRVGLGHHDHHIGVLAVGNKGLLAVENVAVAPRLRRCPHPLQVGAGARLGHGDGADDFALGHARQIAVLLLFGAIGEDVGRHDIRMQRETRPARANTGQFLHYDGRMKPVAAASAIVVGDRRQKQPGLARGQPDGPGDDVVLLPLGVMRRDLALDEFAHLVAIKLVLRRKQGPWQHGHSSLHRLLACFT